MATPSAARDRILTNGLALVSLVGLSGVTLGMLAERVGMSKSGLFAHFRSKEQMELELLEELVRLLGAHVIEPAMKAEPGVARLQALVEAWLGWPARAGLPGGCPVAAVLFELDDLSGPVRERAVEMETRWRALLAGLAGEAMARGEFRPNLDVDQFVWELSGLYLGHQVSERLLKDPKAGARAHRAFTLMVRRSLIPPPRP